MVEAPGTAPGSEWFIAAAIYRHSRQAGIANIGAKQPRRKSKPRGSAAPTSVALSFWPTRRAGAARPASVGSCWDILSRCARPGVAVATVHNRLAAFAGLAQAGMPIARRMDGLSPSDFVLTRRRSPIAFQPAWVAVTIELYRSRAGSARRPLGLPCHHASRRLSAGGIDLAPHVVQAAALSASSAFR
jgi:hypothetical protein